MECKINNNAKQGLIMYLFPSESVKTEYIFVYIVFINITAEYLFFFSLTFRFTFMSYFNYMSIIKFV